MADTMLIPENVPACLRERPQWVVWRYEKRHGRETKVPYCPKSGRRASSADPSTWTSFTDAVAAYARGGYDGIGYVFLTDDLVDSASFFELDAVCGVVQCGAAAPPGGVIEEIGGFLVEM